MQTTTNYAAHATCAHCKKPARGAMVRYKTPSNGHTTSAAHEYSARYLHAECVYDYATNAAAARKAQSGTRNNTRCTYRVTLTTSRDNAELAASLIALDENHWFCVGVGKYISPLWVSFKWWHLFDGIARYITGGHVHIDICTYDGRELAPVDYTWHPMPEHGADGKFVKGTVDTKFNGKRLRELVDAATASIKGYRNYKK